MQPSRVSSASCGENLQTQWWIPEEREAVKLKKESCQVWLAFGIPEASDAYQQAKQAAARVTVKAKTWVLEECGEAIKKVYQLALGKFWHIVRQFNPTQFTAKKESC